VKIAYEISHLLAGVMLVASFALLYQQRIIAVLNAFAAQSITLALAVAWAAWSENRPDLFITAAIAFSLKGVVIPLALRRTVERLGIHREVEKVVGVGVALVVGLALIGLSQALVVKVARSTTGLARDELEAGQGLDGGPVGRGGGDEGRGAVVDDDVRLHARGRCHRHRQ